MNMTDEDIELTFPEGKLFYLVLYRKDTGEEIWRNQEPDPTDDLIVAIKKGELYSIPEEDVQPQEREDTDPAKVPRIDLKHVLNDLGIGEDVDLALSFNPRCFSYQQEFRIDLWR